MTLGEDEEALLLLRGNLRRRRILVLVGESRRISATDLRDRLAISTGSLYHNLKQLESQNLITQDSSRSYLLTEKGDRIYNMLRMGRVAFEQEKPTNPVIERLTSLVFPLWLFVPLYESVAVAVLLPLLSVLLLAVLLASAKHYLVLLYAFSRTSIDPLGFILTFALSILAIFGFSTVASYFLGGQGNHLRFLSASMVSLLPLSLYPAVVLLDRWLQLGVTEGSPAVYVVMLVAQGLTLPFFTAAVSYGKKIRWEKAAIVSLTLFYLTIFVTTLVQTGPPLLTSLPILRSA
ncbi:MAG: helix-turn-helix transcriptional regulator [Aigarchaeota archaeon]|nr:helix-turn-helix transcriptional regulator [Aigarchaeota archaeon]